MSWLRGPLEKLLGSIEVLTMCWCYY